ncbi:hypothetical protein LS71_002695 [Helicobacter jaachi]|uniref:DUF3168 domain-containing protein n=1 Tax=Helicobacter jaachi TaxID=1677920 RepID=A0A4U8TCH0_9HELI|nr:hypothetical protein [Helicobacter jaachi]TLD97666.1 hypothetical protein LS71_002695 [Helicobacter jaachi]
MLIREEISQKILQNLKNDLPKVKVFLEDIFTIDIQNAPVVIVKTKDAQISHASSQAWKHALEIEIELISTSREAHNELVEKALASLEKLGGVKSVNTISMQKCEIASALAFSSVISMEFIYFTPSFRA